MDIVELDFLNKTLTLEKTSCKIFDIQSKSESPTRPAKIIGYLKFRYQTCMLKRKIPYDHLYHKDYVYDCPMSDSQALVDVSTAYCNCDRQQIEEMIYPPPGSPAGILDCCKVGYTE